MELSPPVARVASEDVSGATCSKGELPRDFFRCLVGGLPLLTILGCGSPSSPSCLKFAKSLFASSCIVRA